MSFVDEARILIKAGDGGKGCESFYRDKYTRYPKPDGGNGGKGGDVIFQADKSVQMLLDYRFKQHFQAERGGHGSSKGKKGKHGRDCILRVPIGTLVRDFDNGFLIRDLAEDQQSVVVAKGGAGGRGNRNHRTLTLPGAGEEKTIHLELKVVADVGIVGFPNAGKSTLISNISKVRSKIGNYPFTTRQPILGVVQYDDGSFTVADLPGLIEGAHDGRGLGDKFLKHAERTRVLLHLIDMAGSEGRDPLEDYATIEHELASYSDQLGAKQRLIAANKMDLPGADKNLKKFKKKFGKNIVEISALNKLNLDAIIQRLIDLLATPSS
jgi:GTPase